MSDQNTVEKEKISTEIRLIIKLTELKNNFSSFRPVIMPEYADFYLSQIYKENYDSVSQQIFELFKEYFSRKIELEHTENQQREIFLRSLHRFYWGLTDPKEKVENVFTNSCGKLCGDDEACGGEDGDFKFAELEYYPAELSINIVNPYKDIKLETVGQLGCCVPSGCLTLWGDRRLKWAEYIQRQFEFPQKPNPELPFPLPNDKSYDTRFSNRLNKLFIGDLVWLFYFERMGIFKIIGGILDDYANNGKYPIPSNNITSLIIEMMIRDIKKGTGSTIKDRAYSYARSLGWKLTTQITDIDSSKITVNSGFSRLFHRFITSALYYYKEKRLAEAIKGVQVFSPSTATLIAIQDTISLLKNSIDAFYTGRNYYNTLNGIIWVIASIDLIFRTRDSYGIPLSYKSLEQLIPAAYNVIVEKKSINTADPNRYKLHYECAHDARDILIDIDGNAIDFTSSQKSAELSAYLALIEPRIEGYRVAYKELTGIDLTKEGPIKIEQDI